MEKYPLLGSVLADKKITEAMDLIRKSERLEELLPEKIEVYWDPSIIRAPFIEALTFRELLQLKAENLLKKKSFGNLKIHGLLDALSRALSPKDKKQILRDDALEKVLTYIAKCDSSKEREELLVVLTSDHDLDDLKQKVKEIRKGKKKKKTKDSDSKKENKKEKKKSKKK